VVEPPKIELNGYIDYKVDFVASLSEDQSNSWGEEASISANDPNNVSDEEYYDEENNDGKPKKRFDKDDGTGIVFKKMAKNKTLGKAIQEAAE
jgi:hypothetical protein